MTRFDTWKNKRLAQSKSPTGILPSTADQAGVEFVNTKNFALATGERKKPSWLKQEKFCCILASESHAWRRHSCISTTWDEADYAFEETEEFLEDVRALGCNAVVIPFDWSAGGSVAQEEFNRAKALAETIHRCGLKVGTYFRPDNLWIGTLTKEELEELGDGFQQDSFGHYRRPFGSLSRALCYHHTGPLRRLRRNIERAIHEVKTDILHLDGMIVGGVEGRDACRCPKCIEDFRRFLVERYGHDRALAQRRFGDPCLETKIPPEPEISDSLPCDGGVQMPVWGEWVAFRCAWTTRILDEIAAWTHQLNPEVMIEINNALPAVRENCALLLGMDVINARHYVDAHWSEDAYGPRMHADGVMTHRVRQFKLCRAANGFALTYMAEEEERELRQNLAHTAAFNDGNIGCIGFPPHMNFSNRYNVHFDIKCAFMKWMKENMDLFRDARSDAQVVVWRPRENMAMCGRLAYAAAMRVEQLLLETHRGFDLSFEESIRRISHYDLMVIPNVECMSLKQIEECVAYVEGGGALLVGQSSAAYDLWHRKRIESPWAVLFGEKSGERVSAKAVAEGVAGVFSAAELSAGKGGIVAVKFGKGKAAYVPMIVDPATQPSLMMPDGQMNFGLDYTNWVVPERAKPIDKAMGWLMEDRLRYGVKGKRGLIVEYSMQDKPKRSLVHLVNLATAPQRKCELVVRKAEGHRKIDVKFPPTDKPAKWTVVKGRKELRVVFSLLDTYVIVVLN